MKNEIEFTEEELDNIVAGNSQLHNEEMFEKNLMANKDMFRESQIEKLKEMKQELQETKWEKEGRNR